MILVLLQSTNHNNSHNSLDPPDPDRNGTAMNSILGRLLAIHAVLGAEQLLVAVELAVHEPGAAPEAEHGVALPLHPDFVVGRRARADRALEDDLLAVGQRDGDEGGLLVRELRQSCAQEVA